MSGERDDVVLWITLVFCLLTPVVLVCVWAYTGVYFPPMILSVLLGIAVAALTYRYLGGTQGSEFSVGALKVAGSAALLIGTAYFTNQGLSEQMDSNNSVIRLVESRDEVKKLTAKALSDENNYISETNKLTFLIQQRESEITLLKEKNKIANDKKAIISIGEIEKLSPKSTLGIQIIELANKGKGPFLETKEVKKEVRVTISGNVNKKGKFFACSSLGLVNEKVRFSKINSDSLGEYTTEVSQGGLINTTYCGNPKRKFEIQLNCEDGKTLFPNHISKCLKNGNVGWKVVNGQRMFTLDVSVLSKTNCSVTS